ncbi:MAG: CbiX/SirB N-terminal domain-containing protein [Burkholderiales bacterium]
MHTHGLVLFAHGARDPRWREPFERLEAKVRALRPDLVVSLAFLEMMEPSLGEAVDALVARGCAAIRVVPVFLGQGGHVREDLPAIVERARRRHPDVALEMRHAIGEDEAVIAQIAAVALAGL